MRRVLSTFLVVILLSFSVCSSYVGVSQVKAVGPAIGAALSEETIYELCLYIGTLVSVYIGGSMAANSDDASIARVGKAFVDSIAIDEQDIRNAWIISTTDHVGQTYILGSEALDYIQDTVWEVIQGGAPDPDDDNDDDDEDGKVHLISPDMVVKFTAMGAVWFYDQASKLYQKWVNGEELTEAEAAVFDSLTEGTFSDYESIQNPDGTYHVTGYFYWSNWSGKPNATTVEGDVSGYPFCLISEPSGAYLFSSYTSGSYKSVNLPYQNYRDGKLVGSGTAFNFGMNTGDEWSCDIMNVNVPVFASEDAALAAFEADDFSSALNYAKTYRDADWLAEDSEWKGQLIDPLINTGLSLQQLIDLMKALGLSVLQNQTAPQQLADAIKGLMPGVDPAAAPELLPELLPGVSPQELPDLTPDPQLQPDPEKEPVYWPSPDAHPIADPTPGADPNPAPAPSPDSDPGLDFDFDDVVSDVSGDFSGFGLSLKDKFPFCIPWDIYYLLTKLSDAPKTPVFKLPLYLPRYGIHEDIVIDLSPFESVSKLSRTFLSLLFAFGLIKWTIAFIGMIDDNVTT